MCLCKFFVYSVLTFMPDASLHVFRYNSITSPIATPRNASNQQRLHNFPDLITREKKKVRVRGPQSV